MADKIRFLHTGDIHLGAPVRGLRALDDTWASRLRDAIPEAYERMIETALERAVDFVVIAGDSFDTAQASYRDYLRFFDGLQRLHEAGIPCFLIPGNHDPFTTWQRSIHKLPPSARMLGAEAPEFALYEREGAPLCLIGARGYRSQAWPVAEPIARGISRHAAIEALAPDNPEAARAPFCIGIVHTGLDYDDAKAASDPHELIEADVDYWACAHLHQQVVLPSRDKPKLAFPGCIQGRDLKESGDRGCLLVTMQTEDAANANGRAYTGEAADRAADVRPSISISLEQVSTASVMLQTIRADVSACQTLADIAHHVQAQMFHENAKAACDDMVVKVVLTGTTNLHEFLSQPSTLEDLRKRISNAYPSFFCDTLTDRTRPPRNRQAMLQDGLFEAHVLRVADQQRALPEQMVNYVQAEFVKRGIDVPSSLARKAADFNDAAETLVCDLLERKADSNL